MGIILNNKFCQFQEMFLRKVYLKEKIFISNADVNNSENISRITSFPNKKRKKRRKKLIGYLI